MFITDTFRMCTECSMIAEELLQLCKEESQKNLEIKERIQANNKAIQQLQAQLNEEVKRDIEGETCFILI